MMQYEACLPISWKAIDPIASMLMYARKQDWRYCAVLFETKRHL
jgi:hypothetical protein